jgi:hypothetical protein
MRARVARKSWDEDYWNMQVGIYLVADVGAVAGGWLAGAFMNRGWTVNRARKTTLFICSLMVVPVFYSGLTDEKWIAAVLITLAAAGHQAWSSNLFSVVGDMLASLAYPLAVAVLHLLVPRLELANLDEAKRGE